MEVDPKQIARQLDFQHLGWGDAEAAELLVALRYAAAKCAFPEGAVTVVLKVGNYIHLNVKATLPPGRQTDRAVRERDRRRAANLPVANLAEWEGKFMSY